MSLNIDTSRAAASARPTHVRWDDLVALRPRQVALNLGLSAPWLAGSLWAAQQDLYWLAMPLSAAFFLTALRQAHDSYHASIGVPRRWLDAVLLMLTLGMLCSTHAIRHTHLAHHRNRWAKATRKAAGLGKPAGAPCCWARCSACAPTRRRCAMAARARGAGCGRSCH